MGHMGTMEGRGAIFHLNQSDMAWTEYTSEHGPAAIRYKALTAGTAGVPSVQFIEYGPGQTDPVHRHDVGEFFIVTGGDMWLDDRRISSGGIAFIPANVDYAVRAGGEGVQYFRLVVG